jgi:hypothetical protein
MRRGLHEAMERDALGFPTTRSSTLNDLENLSKQPGPPLMTPNIQFRRSGNSRLRRLLPPGELGRWLRREVA